VGIRRGEPAVIAIRFVCRHCKSEIIHGRKWWRKNLKSKHPNDAWRYRLWSEHECKSCIEDIACVRRIQQAIEYEKAKDAEKSVIATLAAWEKERQEKIAKERA